MYLGGCLKNYSQFRRLSLSNTSFKQGSPPQLNPTGGIPLLKALKDWRKRTADELQRPIFRIMSNQLLEDIARLKPRTVDHLSVMNGVGPFTLRQYGRKVLDIVQQYVREDELYQKGVDTDVFWDNIKAQKKPKKTPKKVTLSEEEQEKKLKELAAKRAKRKQLQVMSEDAIASLEVENTMNIDELNDEQKAAAAHILEGHNVFVTGSAGTGKVNK